LVNIPSTADESVKYHTDSISIRSKSRILSASLTASRAPVSSMLEMEILHFGVTFVFPASSRHCTVPSAICHLR
jgi:hypothetical protein